MPWIDPNQPIGLHVMGEMVTDIASDVHIRLMAGIRIKRLTTATNGDSLNFSGALGKLTTRKAVKPNRS